jgi:hypothetical protein
MVDIKTYKGRIIGPTVKVYFEIGRYWYLKSIKYCIAIFNNFFFHNSIKS